MESRARMRGVSEEIQQRAKELRKHMTTAERRMWTLLRKHRQSGVYFRRQHPLGRYILDFCCTSKRLCIEVDGGVHEQQSERDAERTAWLEQMGYRVLRFRNEEVMETPHLVALRIQALLSADEPR